MVHCNITTIWKPSDSVLCRVVVVESIGNLIYHIKVKVAVVKARYGQWKIAFSMGPTGIAEGAIPLVVTLDSHLTC